MSQFPRFAAAILLIAGATQLPSSSRQTLHAAETKPLAADLITAIRNGDEPAIRKLLEGGADVNGRDKDGNTPLLLASLYAGPDCVKLLLQKGADPNAANNVGATPLIRAATSPAKVRLLLAAGARVQVRTTDLGNTPLILAARRNGNSETVKLLLDRGADAREANQVGVTPILAAAASGDVETAKLLLDKGANPNHFPELKGPNDALASGSRTALMWAAYHNDLPMIRLLLERGADPNQVIVFGTALSHAAWHGSLEAAELLIERGANVDARDLFAGFTPLHWAASSESPRADFVKLLLAKGADPNAAGGAHIAALGLTPQTPRMLAEKRGRTAIVEALIAAGAKEPPPVERFAVPDRKVPEPLTTEALTAATEQALAALQTTAAESRQAYLRHVSHQDCLSCHQQFLPMAAVGHARGHAVRFDQKAAQEQLALGARVTHPFFQPEYLAQTVFHPDPAYGIGYEHLGLVAENAPPTTMSDAEVHHLVTVQSADGRWFNNLPRPPMQSSDVGATALVIQAIQRYGWPGRRQEFAACVDRARKWLWQAQPETTDDAVFQLLGLHWAGEPPAKLARPAGALLKLQRPDGGWAQLPALDSDAYATGQALYALARAAELPVTDPAWQRGVRFLLKTQGDDGTWRVARRAFPFQPTMDSGFPHHRDSWISATATSWVVMALTQALPAGTAADAPLVAKQTAPLQSQPQGEKVAFTEQIKPLLERSCVGCHAGGRPAGLLRVDLREALLKGGESGTAAVVPGQSVRSLLIEYVSDRSEAEMPPRATRDKFPALSKEEVTLLRRWIDQGAEWPNGVTLATPKSETPR